MSEINIIMTGNTAGGDIIGTTSSGVKPAEVDDLFNHILNAPDNITLKDICDWLLDTKNICFKGVKVRPGYYANVTWYLSDVIYFALQKRELMENTLKFLEHKKFPLRGTLRLNNFNGYI
jgi:hypothetical protein